MRRKDDPSEATWNPLHDAGGCSVLKCASPVPTVWICLGRGSLSSLVRLWRLGFGQRSFGVCRSIGIGASSTSGGTSVLRSGLWRRTRSIRLSATDPTLLATWPRCFRRSRGSTVWRDSVATRTRPSTLWSLSFSLFLLGFRIEHSGDLTGAEGVYTRISACTSSKVHWSTRYSAHTSAHIPQ